MKKALFTFAILSLASTAAFAQEWAFDAPYWKGQSSATSYQTEQTQSAVQSTKSAEAFEKYGQVDHYNP